MKLETLDVKDKIIVLSGDIEQDFIDSIAQQREKMFEMGCLGVIVLPKGAKVESLGLSNLEAMVKQIKERIDGQKA